MPCEILCVGHAAFDVSLFVEGFPAENSKCEIQQMVEAGGGPAANAAYLLSSWGVSTAFAGVVGQDRYGMQICDEFNSAGTDISLLEQRANFNTPFSVILVNRENGSRTVINRKVATAPLRLGTSAARTLAPKVLLFDGHELESSLQCLELFPNALSILDGGSMREGTRQLAGKVDYLAASERFALRATGLPNVFSESEQQRCAEALRQMFGTTIIVTLGERGLFAQNDAEFISMPAFPAKAVDTTAAGDIFHGAFAYALLKVLPFVDALKLASMAASLSVGRAGGRTSIPTLSNVNEALKHDQ